MVSGGILNGAVYGYDQTQQRKQSLIKKSLIRQKQAKQKANFKAVVSAFVILLLVSSTIVLTWFVFGSIIKISGLVFQLKGLLEIVINSCLVISYIFLLLLVYIYLIDLFHMIFNMLLENVLIPFNKNPKFLDNSLMDYIDKFTKKPKLLGKALSVTAIILFVFLCIGYFTKTYFYRSFSDIKSEEHVEIIDLSMYSNIKKLLIDVDSSNIIITKGDSLKLTVSSEFERTNKIEVINETLKFTTDSLQEFDMFGLFSEPIPYIEITIPDDLTLTCLNKEGIINLSSVMIKDLSLSTNSGNIILTDSKLQNINIYMEKGGINITNCNFNDGLIESRAGNVLLESNKCNDLEFINGAAKVNINNSYLNKIKLFSDSGTVFINKMDNLETVIEVNSCTLDLKQVNSNDNININALYKSAVTVYESKTSNLSVVMNGGTFTGYYLEMNGNIQTTGSTMLSYIVGNFDIVSLGKYCDIYEYMGTTLNLQTQLSETTLKYVKTEYLTYNSNNSKSLLYFVYGKDMIVLDPKGEIILDNSITISDDLVLYEQYKMKIERLNISPSAAVNVDKGVEIGAWE